MKSSLLRYLLSIALVASLGVAAGCAKRQAHAPNLPPPTPSTTVGPGDVFSILIVGEKDLPQEFRVQPDGTIDFPYLDRLTVAGLEPQGIEELIKKDLIEKKILVSPQVTLVVKQYNSKKISIIGAVARPGSIAWSEGMKLIDAISQSGGLTPIADGDHVRITRTVGSNRTVTATVSVDDIADGKLSDIPLQAGDTIKIDQRFF